MPCADQSNTPIKIVYHPRSVFVARVEAKPKPGGRSAPETRGTQCRRNPGPRTIPGYGLRPNPGYHNLALRGAGAATPDALRRFLPHGCAVRGAHVAAKLCWRSQNHPA